MCGIAGVMGVKDAIVIKNMMERIRHRGPDHHTYEVLDNIHLAHTRLSIIDLSPSSNQPLWDAERRVCIVFNGEIYNYLSIREDLIKSGYVFRSQGDTEVILNLYLQEGIQCLEKLRGIFAFALWDAEKEELLLVRDGFGIKPLYYSSNTDSFFFSSELKSLLEVPGISKELNYDAIFRTIVFLWSPGPETILKNVYKLEPGHYLIIKNNQIQEHESYWSWPAYKPLSQSKQEAQKKLDKLLTESVHEQLIADVPVGAFLSGGVDSSLIVALAQQLGVDGLECFTIEHSTMDKDADGFANDLPYAKEVAKYLNVNLNIVKMHPTVLNDLSRMVYYLDEPQADVAPINVMYICEEAKKQQIKVLLSGAGGDDLFTGYRRHQAIELEKYWKFFPKIIQIFLQNICKKIPKKNHYLRKLSKLFQYANLTDNESILSYFYWMDPEDARKIFTKEIQEKLSKNPMQFMLKNLDALPGKNKLERMLDLERRYFLVDHNLNYTDKMAMAHGVEVRVPFLDPRLASFASELKTNLKQKNGQGKWILKKVAERYLPKSVVYRSKSGFGAPLRHWLKKDLTPLIEDVLSEESLRNRGLFNAQNIKIMLQKNMAGNADYSYSLFALICIELWCRIFIDKDPRYRF